MRTIAFITLIATLFFSGGLLALGANRLVPFLSDPAYGYVLLGTVSGAAVSLYLAPSFIAATRFHPNFSAIVALNVLLGWSFLGWVVALVWALAHPKPQNSGQG
jgi:hypothetical protein